MKTTSKKPLIKAKTAAERKKVLQEIAAAYLNPKQAGSLAGASTLRRNLQTPTSREEVQEALETLDPYTVHRARRQTFQRNPIVVTNLKQQFQSDLMDITKYARTNQGCRFILLTIDVFSKKISCQLLRRKTGVNVQKAMEKMFAELGVPAKLQVDKGKRYTVRKSCKCLAGMLQEKSFTIKM
jgi:hypothetical protein